MRVQRSKLMYRVVFPFELKLGCAAAEGCDAADTPYSLFAVIVHVGSGLDHGANGVFISWWLCSTRIG